MLDYKTIDWADKNAPISRYFTVGDATFLPSWSVYHVPSEGEQKNIVSFADKLDVARDIIGIPFIIHCWIRPLVANVPDSNWNGQNYNEYIGSKASKGGHPMGRACDFHVRGYAGSEYCLKMRQLLFPKLEVLQLRMEYPVGVGDWIHLDDLPVLVKRYFKP